ncbi:hypothetical protein SRB17_22750 [Streptomyces sp. RB17]|uniref:hypothetical protein n=1 Tax=Streptomyces sp. RB17 TaxID=2585197 RepID=UPI001297A8D1|nr:hypothetical protein [Streptomyces sp. RB17]MQY34309.1 hypothetical protein [Streptomyces sp. RB17]
MRGALVGTAVTLAAGALLTTAMTTASASPPTPPGTGVQASPARPVLVDCFFHRNVRPADFILACGDGNSRLTGLHWSQWGPDGAKAVGVNWVNDCDPYCAAGTFHQYPVVIRLTGEQQWKKHPSFERYAQMSLTYTGARPKGFNQVMTYPLWD